jgi:Heterokaryon incompatibility protein (HET)
MDSTREGGGLIYGRLISPTFSIRLLTFNPVDETHPLSCNVRSYELNSCPPYVALSYEWGEVEPQVEIMINGFCFQIRHNLCLFLSVLKEKQNRQELSADLRLWIDAICIDQQDMFERNAQVAMMGQIYQKATSVLAWLGWPQGWDSRLTFEFLKWSSRSIPFHTVDDSGEICAETRETRKFWGLEYSELLQMALKMCKSRYWSRRWVVQEILLARSVTFIRGEDDLSRTVLHTFLRQLSAFRAPQEWSMVEELKKKIPFVMSKYRAGDASFKPQVTTIRELLVMFHGTDWSSAR